MESLLSCSIQLEVPTSLSITAYIYNTTNRCPLRDIMSWFQFLPCWFIMETLFSCMTKSDDPDPYQVLLIYTTSEVNTFYESLYLYFTYWFIVESLLSCSIHQEVPASLLISAHIYSTRSRTFLRSVCHDSNIFSWWFIMESLLSCSIHLEVPASLLSAVFMCNSRKGAFYKSLCLNSS